MMKTKTAMTATATIIGLLVILAMPAYSQQSSLFGPNNEIRNVSYLIYETNETATYYWYYSINETLLTYSVQNDTIFRVDFITNSQDPFMKIQLGTLTLQNTTDADVESNLGLGYWTIAKNGIISNTSWEKLEQEYTIMLADTNDNFTFSQGSGTYVGGIVETVAISIEGVFQHSFMVYEKESGLLLEARLKIGNFVLSFIAMKISDDAAFYAASENSTTDETKSAFLPILGIGITSIGIVSLIGIRKKR